MKKKKVLWLLSLIAVIFAPRIIFGWGSTTSASYYIPYAVDYWATHQYIEGIAYNAVTNDLAFRPGSLPSFNQLEEWAGNNLSFVSMEASGKGPDAEGKSNYGEHWYNFLNDKGNAPESVRLHITSWLETGNVKGIDWAAHYLADVSTPVHMFGTSRDEILSMVAKALQGAGRHATQTVADLNMPLDPIITGPDGAKGRNWAYEIQAFRNKATNSWIDYFDPWYYDTNGVAILAAFGNEITRQSTSTHAAWEFNRPQHTAGRTGGYNPEWRNPETPSFTSYQQDFGAKASLFTKLAAAATRRDYNTLTTYPTATALGRAFTNVATLWRASFSALYPEISTTPSSDVDTPNGYDIEALVENASKAPVQNVQLQFTVEGATLLKGKKLNPIGNMKGESKTEKKDAVKWTIETDDPRNCVATLELIGSYSVPDLQYRRVTYRLKNYEATNSLVFVIDATGSMAGEKLANAKSTAISEISKLDEKTEVAVIAFSGCAGGISIISSFKLMTPQGISAVCSAVKNIAAGNDTNIAEATAFAGNYIRTKGRGKVRRALILLTDGVETCNGDPAAAVKEVNTITRTETEIPQ